LIHQGSEGNSEGNVHLSRLGKIWAKVEIGVAKSVFVDFGHFISAGLHGDAAAEDVDIVVGIILQRNARLWRQIHDFLRWKDFGKAFPGDIPQELFGISAFHQLPVDIIPSVIAAQKEIKWFPMTSVASVQFFHVINELLSFVIGHFVIEAEVVDQRLAEVKPVYQAVIMRLLHEFGVNFPDDIRCGSDNGDAETPCSS